MSEVRIRASLRGETVYLVTYTLGLGVAPCEVLRGPSPLGTVEVRAPGGARIRAKEGKWCRTEVEAREAVAGIVAAARSALAEKLARDSARLDEIDAGLARGELPTWA